MRLNRSTFLLVRRARTIDLQACALIKVTHPAAGIRFGLGVRLLRARG